MNQKSIERTFVLVKILQEIGPAWTFSTYVLFLIGNSLSLFEVSMLNLVFMSVSSILDPFTGNLGDRIGQKKVYLLGLFLWSLGALIYGSSKSFGFFALAEATAAVGHALMSEALESWLRNHTKEKVSHRALSKAGYRSKLATIPTAVIGGLIGAKWGLNWPWIFSGLTSLVTLIVACWLLRAYPDESRRDNNKELSLLAIVKKSWQEPVLKRSFIAVALITFTFQPFNMFWSVIFKEASGNSEWLGFLWIGIALASALGSFLAKKWPVNSKGLSMIIFSIGLPMILPLFRGNWIALMLIPFLIHEIGRSTWLPVLFTYTNRKIEKETRTSVNSIRSSAGTMGAAAGLFVSGFLTKWLTPVEVWEISAIELLIISLWIWRWNHD
jgi:MFS family permease